MTYLFRAKCGKSRTYTAQFPRITMRVIRVYRQFAKFNHVMQYQSHEDVSGTLSSKGLFL